MNARPDHVDVAAYVLGILDEDEVDAFENHLAQCRRCALDLRDFAVLPDLLDEADANGMLRANAGERPDGRSVRAMLDSVSQDRSRRRRNTVLLAAAAAVLLVVLTAIVSVGLSSSPDDDVATATSSTVPGPTAVAKNAPDVSGTVTRTDSATGVWARINATPEPWGTSVALEVKGAKGPTRCELVARSQSGETVVVASWLVGSSTPDKDPVQLNSSVGMRWHEIAEFSVRDTKEGNTLVRLPTT
ncbi:anti-sigma factor RsiW [Saccharothrix tamanrassetensis]|uniref:Anti-sigma factor RsiW n=1 Tax=Saccharothrix tamanrassetensis TaxID=1051531 RepID=A0A841CLC1_9PSEU|nr:zf-HC2 domain-containing protein [Saccharothrix tamanrassetensis]MBB5956897.1 anti-sigma factor RsiW [Saccharothrix tamanrassetensis]